MAGAETDRTHERSAPREQEDGLRLPRITTPDERSSAPQRDSLRAIQPTAQVAPRLLRAISLVEKICAC